MSGSKVLISLSIRLVEVTSNGILGFVENCTIGSQLPINVTEGCRLAEGLRIQNIYILSHLKNFFFISLASFRLFKEYYSYDLKLIIGKLIDSLFNKFVNFILIKLGE